MAFAAHATLTEVTKVSARGVVLKTSGTVLCTADTNCPTSTGKAKGYFMRKIEACTDDAQIIAITNSIHAALP